MEYTAVIKQDGEWWIGWIEEIPGVNCQEKTKEQLVESLKVTLKEAIEFNKIDAITLAGSNFSEENDCMMEAVFRTASAFFTEAPPNLKTFI